MSTFLSALRGTDFVVQNSFCTSVIAETVVLQPVPTAGASVRYMLMLAGTRDGSR